MATVRRTLVSSNRRQERARLAKRSRARKQLVQNSEKLPRNARDVQINLRGAQKSRSPFPMMKFGSAPISLLNGGCAKVCQATLGMIGWRRGDNWSRKPKAEPNDKRPALIPGIEPSARSPLRHRFHLRKTGLHLLHQAIDRKWLGQKPTHWRFFQQLLRAFA